MEIVRKLIEWGIKFLRYLALNIFIGGILDLFVFNPMQGAVRCVLERDYRVAEDGDWVGELTVDTGGQMEGKI